MIKSSAMIKKNGAPAPVQGQGPDRASTYAVAEAHTEMTPAQPLIAAYTRPARYLHWLVAVLVLGMFTLGFYMEGLPLSPDKLKLYSWHKWAGVSIFMLVLIRLAWRVTHRPPPLPDHMAPWMKVAAHGGHAALYVLMLVIPLSGWLMSSALGIQTVWFGIVPLPDLIPRDKAVGEFLQATHLYLNLFFMAVLVGHIGMALKHHFVDKDGTLHRMLPVAKSED